jgi:hypothetical protein
MTQSFIPHLILLAACALPAVAADKPPERHWPTFPLPNRLIVQARPAELGPRVVQQTLSGLLAHHVKTTGQGPMLWIDKRHPAYRRWQQRWADRTGVKIERTALDIWALTQSFHKAGVVRGYVLYQEDRDKQAPHDPSINIATSLCAPLGAIAVEASLEAEAKAIGLKQLEDARNKSHAWLNKTYGRKLNRKYVGLLKPEVDHMRDLCVALGAEVTLNDETGGYEPALARATDDAVALGWGITSEYKFVSAANEQGMVFVPAEFTMNVPILASGNTGAALRLKRPPPPPKPLAGTDSKRQVAFILSDGDNVAWAMDNLTTSRRAWADKTRGSLPFGWTVPWAHGLQTCPDVLDYMSQTAQPNDDLIPFGGGYVYLDRFGLKRNRPAALEREAVRLNSYLANGRRTTMISFSKEWNSDAAKQAYGVLAKRTTALHGLFMLQYAPYAKGRGEIIWAKRNGQPDLPILSAKASIWHHKKNNKFAGTPEHVANLLNTWNKKPIAKTQDRFTWVVVHLWSVFDDPKTNKKYGGYEAAVRCAKYLDPGIVVVTPSQLIQGLIAASKKN